MGENFSIPWIKELYDNSVDYTRYYQTIYTGGRNANRTETIKKELNAMFGLNLENKIKKVIFNGPATIVIWFDGSKTVVKCKEDEFFDKEKGLAMAIVKKMNGNDNSFHKIFKKHCPDIGEVWDTAVRNKLELERAYNKGLRDGVE